MSLRGLAVVLLGLGFIGSVHAQSDAAFTDYRTLVGVAFPAREMLARHRVPEAEVSARLERIREQILADWSAMELIWGVTLDRVLQGQGSRLQAHRPLALLSGAGRRAWVAMKESPIYICNTACRCPSASGYACAQGKQLGESVSTVIVVPNCVLTGEKCESRTTPSSKRETPLAPSVDQLLRRAMLQAGVMRTLGLLTPGDLSRVTEALEDEFSRLASPGSQMRRSCASGVLPQSALDSLKEMGQWKSLDGTWRECGVSLLRPLVRSSAQIPSECRLVLDASRWADPKRMAAFERPLEVGRCQGETCVEWTCGETARDVPRLVQFSGRLVLELPQDACQGRQPTRAGPFFGKLLRDYVRKPLIGTPSGEVLIRGCVRAFSTLAGQVEPAETARPPSTSHTSGFEVELIQ